MRLWYKRIFTLLACTNALLVLLYLLLGRAWSERVAIVHIDDPLSGGVDQLLDAADFAQAASHQLRVKLAPSLPRVAEEGVSCAKVFSGNAVEQRRALAIGGARPVPLDYRSDEFFAGQTCAAIRQRFVTESLSAEEANFPLAFGLVVFKDFFQVEKLFRAVYRPEHVYCFHVDAKSPDSFHQAVSQYASCLGGNVVLADRRIDVSWGRFSVLEAELVTMQKLLKLSTKWRYFINLTGQEYPLRTTLEIVRILKALNGANNLENAGPRDTIRPLSVQLEDGSTVPVQWYKGSVHIAATRGFVEFALSDTGRQISEHLRIYARLPCADETFFATLNNNPKLLKVPGSDRSGLLTDNVRQPFLNRYKNWIFGVFGYPCLSGRIVRQLCIWGVQDLPAMNQRFELFVNKFYFNFQRLGLQCMEERFWNNTMADYGVPGYSKTHQIPVQFYSDFEFVRNHV